MYLVGKFPLNGTLLPGKSPSGNLLTAKGLTMVKGKQNLSEGGGEGSATTCFRNQPFQKWKFWASGMNNKFPANSWAATETLVVFLPLGREEVASCCCCGTPSATNSAGALPPSGTERWRERDMEAWTWKDGEREVESWRREIIVMEERWRHISSSV